MSTAPVGIRVLLHGLVDDAAMFPPEQLPLEVAVPEHHTHRKAPYADLVGSFVCTDEHLAAVARANREAAAGPLRVSVVVSGGAGGIEPVVGFGRRCPDVEVHAVEVRLRDVDDLTGSARRVVRASESCVDTERVFVEVGLDGGWHAALDVVADAGYAAKLRTGGQSADLFPDTDRVAAFLAACLDRELPFKCTAGLHHAVRHTAAATGFEHHGFLNVLLATRVLLDGAGLDQAAAVLADRDGPDLAGRARALDERQATGVRRWFTSFGSCSIADPLEDITTLGLAG